MVTSITSVSLLLVSLFMYNTGFSRRVVVTAENISASLTPHQVRPVPETSANKVIVYTCTESCGGWADRQKGIVSAFVLATILGRKFKIFIPTPCDLGHFLVPHAVDWRLQVDELDKKDIQRISQMDVEGLDFIKRLVSMDNMEQELPHQYTLILWNMEVVKYLLKHSSASKVSWLVGKSVAEVYKTVMDKLFVPTAKLKQILDSFQNSIPAGRQLVCAQVRVGQHANFPDVITFQTSKNFPALVHFLTKFNDSHKYRILFSSDSTEFIEYAKQRFSKVAVTIPGPITHVDKTVGREACDGFGKAIADEIALSKCHVLVISESGLGKIASFMRNSDSELYLFHGDTIEKFNREDSFPSRPDW